MRLRKISLLCQGLLILAVITCVAADFSYPPPTDRVRFTIGDTRIIRFETEWEEYSIALYQQEKEENSARQGPTLIETQNGAGHHSFAWPVETYGLKLDDSESFFFWIFRGDASNQGDLSKPSMASPFFSITDCKKDCARKTGETTAISSLFLVSATSVTEEALLTATTLSGGTFSESNSTLQPTETSTGSSATSASPSSTRDQRAGGLGSTMTKPSQEDETSDPNEQHSDESSSGMSKETKIGIGVGAGVGGLILIGGLGFLIFKYNMKGREHARKTVKSFFCRGQVNSQFLRNSGSNAER